MITDRSNMLCILRILEEYSDESHILSVADIREKLKTEYDINPDRRTIYGAVSALNDFGYEISTYEQNGKGYYLLGRKFEPAEIRLLMDAVYSCRYISTQQTKELLDKIRSFSSVHERKKYTFANIVNPDKKSPNHEIFLNIEILDNAINEKRKISFTYLRYDEKKKLVPRREAPYIANPYAMICENEHYYLVLILDGHDDPSFYRIDMIKDIKVLDEHISIPAKDAKLGSLKNVVYAYSGEPVSIELLCDDIGLRYCIEKFGKDIAVYPSKDEKRRHKVMISAAPQGMLYWALQYIQHIELTKPLELRKQISKAIKESNY